MGDSSGLLHKVDPETLLSCSEPQGDTWARGRHLGRCFVLPPWHSWPSAAHPWIVKQHFGGVIRAFSWGLSSGPPSTDNFFVKWRSSPEGHHYFFSLQDGADKQVETFSCHPGQCHKEGQDLRFSSVLSLFYQLSPHAETQIQPTFKQPLPVPSVGNALQPRAAWWTKTSTRAQMTDYPAGTGLGHPLVLTTPVQVVPHTSDSCSCADPSSNRSI